MKYIALLMLLSQLTSQSTTKTDFNSFLSHFNNDSTFQLKSISFPLATKSLDMEDNIETTLMNSDDWKIINLSSDKNTENRNFDAYQTIVESTADTSYVKIQGIDNGISIDYIFIRDTTSWKLVEIFDASN